MLQEREFQRLGGTRLLRANVRVIAATNRDLRDAITRGTFREDLYYRLGVFDIQLPPLAREDTGYSAARRGVSSGHRPDDRPPIFRADAGGEGPTGEVSPGRVTFESCATCWNVRRFCATEG